MTQTLKLLGFFRELPHGRPDGPSLRSSMRDAGDPNEGDLTSYLSAGATLATTGRMTKDVLVDDSTPVAPLATLTDGVWIWPAYLAYYVRRYHVRVPDDFVVHAASRGWNVPDLTDEDLLDAEARVPRG
jgi:hypothetical protein